MSAKTSGRRRSIGTCDEVIKVSDREAFTITRRLAREEGMLVGGSCGLAVAAAIEVAAAAETG